LTFVNDMSGKKRSSVDDADLARNQFK